MMLEVISLNAEIILAVLAIIAIVTLIQDCYHDVTRGACASERERVMGNAFLDMMKKVLEWGRALVRKKRRCPYCKSRDVIRAPYVLADDKVEYWCQSCTHDFVEREAGASAWRYNPESGVIEPPVETHEGRE